MPGACRSQRGSFVAAVNPQQKDTNMQFLMLIQIANDSDYEAGKLPSAALEAAMGELMEEWTKTGAMVSAAGLKPTSQAARVRLSPGKVMVTDGPFAESKEVIGGFFILEAPDKAAA